MTDNHTPAVTNATAAQTDARATNRGTPPAVPPQPAHVAPARPAKSIARALAALSGLVL